MRSGGFRYAGWGTFRTGRVLPPKPRCTSPDTHGARGMAPRPPPSPGVHVSRHLLATVLDLSGESAEAETLLRGVLAEQPEFGDARYLLGKILLAAGAAGQAVPHLEAAVRISPDHASYHYQLAQAYRRLGDIPAFERHLARFQTLKNTARGKAP